MAKLFKEDVEEEVEEQVEEHGFYRYVDVDGDGITYRTLAGNEHPKSAYLNRGTGHSEYAV